MHSSSYQHNTVVVSSRTTSYHCNMHVVGDICVASFVVHSNYAYVKQYVSCLIVDICELSEFSELRFIGRWEPLLNRE
jgi:hypothetical protein